MECRDFESSWIGAGLELDRLDHEAREHLQSCDSCHNMVDEEIHLLKTLSALQIPDTLGQRERILTIIADRKRQRSYWTALPICTSGLVLFAGVLSWGGLPAGHLIADFPQRALQSASSLLSTLGTSLEVGAQAAGAASRLLPSFLEIPAVLLTLGGLALSAEIYRRWKHRWMPHF